MIRSDKAAESLTLSLTGHWYGRIAHGSDYKKVRVSDVRTADSEVKDVTSPGCYVFYDS